MSARKPPGTAVVRVGDKNTVRELIGQMKESLAEVLPKHLTPDRVLKMALIAVSRQSKLFECTKESFARSVMQSAELGLDCSGTLGSAYLVPYWSNKLRAFEAQFIPGYRGLIDLARRSGQVPRIEAHLVHEKDRYEVQFGTDPKLIHEPYLEGDPGKVVMAYMVAELEGGQKQVEVMTVSQLDGIKARSKSRNKQGELVGPWVTDEGEMQRKTVVRRGVKYLPLSPEQAKDLAKALDYDQDLLDVEAMTQITSEDREKELDARLKEEAPPAKEPEGNGLSIQEYDEETKEKQRKLWGLLEKKVGMDPVKCDELLHEISGNVDFEQLHGVKLDAAIMEVEKRLENKKPGELFPD